jgi:hypothetical protein
MLSFDDYFTYPMIELTVATDAPAVVRCAATGSRTSELPALDFLATRPSMDSLEHYVTLGAADGQPLQRSASYEVFCSAASTDGAKSSSHVDVYATRQTVFAGAMGFVRVRTVLEDEDDRAAWLAAAKLDDPCTAPGFDADERYAAGCDHHYPQFLSLVGPKYHGADPLETLQAFLLWKEPGCKIADFTQVSVSNVGDQPGKALYVTAKGSLRSNISSSPGAVVGTDYVEIPDALCGNVDSPYFPVDGAPVLSFAPMQGSTSGSISVEVAADTPGFLRCVAVPNGASLPSLAFLDRKVPDVGSSIDSSACREEDGSATIIYAGSNLLDDQREEATVLLVPSGVADVEITLHTDKAAQFALLDALYPAVCIFGSACGKASACGRELCVAYPKNWKEDQKGRGSDKTDDSDNSTDNSTERLLESYSSDSRTRRTSGREDEEDQRTSSEVQRKENIFIKNATLGNGTATVTISIGGVTTRPFVLRVRAMEPGPTTWTATIRSAAAKRKRRCPATVQVLYALASYGRLQLGTCSGDDESSVRISTPSAAQCAKNAADRGFPFFAYCPGSGLCELRQLCEAVDASETCAVFSTAAGGDDVFETAAGIGRERDFSVHCHTASEDATAPETAFQDTSVAIRTPRTGPPSIMLAPVVTTAHSVKVNVQLDIAGSLICGVAERDARCVFEEYIDLWETKMNDIRQRIAGSSSFTSEKRDLVPWQAEDLIIAHGLYGLTCAEVLASDSYDNYNDDIRSRVLSSVGDADDYGSKSDSSSSGRVSRLERRKDYTLFCSAVDEDGFRRTIYRDVQTKEEGAPIMTFTAPERSHHSLRLGLSLDVRGQAFCAAFSGSLASLARNAETLRRSQGFIRSFGTRFTEVGQAGATQAGSSESGRRLSDSYDSYASADSEHIYGIIELFGAINSDYSASLMQRSTTYTVFCFAEDYDGQSSTGWEMAQVYHDFAATFEWSAKDSVYAWVQPTALQFTTRGEGSAIILPPTVKATPQRASLALRVDQPALVRCVSHDKVNEAELFQYVLPRPVPRLAVGTTYAYTLIAGEGEALVQGSEMSFSCRSEPLVWRSCFSAANASRYVTESDRSGEGNDYDTYDSYDSDAVRRSLTRHDSSTDSSTDTYDAYASDKVDFQCIPVRDLDSDSCDCVDVDDSCLSSEACVPEKYCVPQACLCVKDMDSTNSEDCDIGLSWEVELSSTKARVEAPGTPVIKTETPTWSGKVVEAHAQIDRPGEVSCLAVRRGAFPPTMAAFESGAPFFAVDEGKTKTIVLDSVFVTSPTIEETIIRAQAGEETGSRSVASVSDFLFTPDRGYTIYCAARATDGSRVQRSTQADIEGTSTDIVAQIREPASFFVASGFMIASIEYTAQGAGYRINLGLEDSCENGGTPVSDLAECAIAAQALGIDFKGTLSISSGPVGCARFALGSIDMMYFNIHPDGSVPLGGYSKVCRRDPDLCELAPLPYGWSRLKRSEQIQRAAFASGQFPNLLSDATVERLQDGSLLASPCSSEVMGRPLFEPGEEKGCVCPQRDHKSCSALILESESDMGATCRDLVDSLGCCQCMCADFYTYVPGDWSDCTEACDSDVTDSARPTRTRSVGCQAQGAAARPQVCERASLLNLATTGYCNSHSCVCEDILPVTFGNAWTGGVLTSSATSRASLAVIVNSADCALPDYDYRGRYECSSGFLADLPSCMPTGTPTMSMDGVLGLVLITWVGFSLKFPFSAEQLEPEVASSVASLLGLDTSDVTVVAQRSDELTYLAYLAITVFSFSEIPITEVESRLDTFRKNPHHAEPRVNLISPILSQALEAGTLEFGYAFQKTRDVVQRPMFVAAPAVTAAAYGQGFMQVVVRFDSEVAVPAECVTVLSLTMVEAFGPGFVCEWEKGRVLRIRLGSPTTFGVGNNHVLELVGFTRPLIPNVPAGTALLYRKTPRESYALAYDPKDAIEVAVQLRGPTVVQTCTGVSLEASVTGTGGRPPTVVWSCGGCDELEGLPTEPYLAAAQGTFALQLPAQAVQVSAETVVNFTISVTNFLDSTAHSLFQLTIKNSGPALPIVTLGTPADQVFPDQRVNFAIETKRAPDVEGCATSGTANTGGTVYVNWQERSISSTGVEEWTTFEEDDNPNPNVFTLLREPDTLYEYRAVVGYEDLDASNTIVTSFRGRTAALPPVVVSIAAPASAKMGCAFVATVSVSSDSIVTWALVDEAGSVVQTGEVRSNATGAGEVSTVADSVGEHQLRVNAVPLNEAVPQNGASQTVNIDAQAWPQAALVVPFVMPEPPPPPFMSGNEPVTRVPTRIPHVHVTRSTAGSSACADASMVYFTVGLCAAPCAATPILETAAAVVQESSGSLAPVSMQPTEGAAYQYVLIATRSAQEQSLNLESVDGTTSGVVLAYSPKFYVDSTPTGGVARVLGGVTSPAVGYAGQTAFTIQTSDWQDEAPSSLIASFYVLRMPDSQASLLSFPLSAAAVPELPSVDWVNAASPRYWETMGWVLVGGPKQSLEQRDVMLGPGTYFVVVRIKDDMGNTALAKTACLVELPREVEDISKVEDRFHELQETNDADAILGFVNAQAEVTNMRRSASAGGAAVGAAADGAAVMNATEAAQADETTERLVTLGMTALQTSRSFAETSPDNTIKQAKLVEKLTDASVSMQDSNVQLGLLSDALFGKDSILADQKQRQPRARKLSSILARRCR